MMEPRDSQLLIVKLLNLPVGGFTPLGMSYVSELVALCFQDGIQDVGSRHSYGFGEDILFPSLRLSPEPEHTGKTALVSCQAILESAPNSLVQLYALATWLKKSSHFHNT